MMTQKKFRYLAECYGAELSRWPEVDRERAETLLVQSPEARIIQRAQQDVDTVIMRAFDAQDAELHAQSAYEDPHAALTRLRAGVAGRLTGRNAIRRSLRGGWRFIPRPSGMQPSGVMTADGLVLFRFAGLALGCAFVVTGGLWLGWVQSASTASDLFNTLLVFPVSGGGS
ncbi:hypothetical protein [Acetobacter orleanensis]|uniref:Uncharacterized protein n=1 Tax=Acetobacter orleanensis TaxID=104099 RepID=A0A4Y3TQW4_9PROT|nr:hypothetical protein [Acetobacter orleanensis]KXV66688.1 hypothetical protein AD949_01740 [Acetobacter orleanensis]PCD78665.1 hypothetical protein CO710_10685 [Acetobacter orleanensis]GAN69685.1 hypothetical protein Abol_050_018 [Acetobacter orleanensis JCM 7639]GBR26125.1 hypothetical protein AA0473_1065 [Acetobacter orleanensis NRIC 0473]GEB83410.1 hypothetical protein AOR01nite_18870 [Acetobacter orleanensis]